jgi:hypothetical protein
VAMPGPRGGRRRGGATARAAGLALHLPGVYYSFESSIASRSSAGQERAHAERVFLCRKLSLTENGAFP